MIASLARNRLRPDAPPLPTSASFADLETPMTHSELAWEFAELFGDLDVDDINQVLAKNVPFETLEFFDAYAAGVADHSKVDDAMRRRLPNLMLLGYLLRVLEERLIEGDEGEHDA